VTGEHYFTAQRVERRASRQGFRVLRLQKRNDAGPVEPDNL
jgi:hypothetical protein